MGQVILNLEEYEELRKKADANKAMKEAIESLKECFVLEKDYKGEEITLAISNVKAAEIFNIMFEASEFNDGTYELKVDPGLYTSSIASHRIKAVKKADESAEELKEVLTQEASEFNDGTYELKVDPGLYTSSIASHRIKAVKKADESAEELKEVLTQEKNQEDEE